MALAAGEDEQTDQSTNTHLVVDPFQPFVVGIHPTITMRLTGQYNKPLAHQVIRVFIDGHRKAQAQTDNNGVATVVLQYVLSAGVYHLKFVYYGIPTLGLSSTTVPADMIIQPSETAIYVVPPMSGINVKFAHKIYVSDQNGKITIPVYKSGVYPVEVLPIEQDTLPSNIRVTFSRWNDEVFTAYRETYFPVKHQLEIGLLISYRVNEVFYDTSGGLVDPSRISSMSLRKLGQTFTFDQAGVTWLPSNRIVRRLGRQLENQPVVYSFKDIMIDGTNVVNQNQQRFHVRPDDTWPVKVLVYSIHFSAQDAMFHQPIGKGVRLTYPDGHTQDYSFDPTTDDIFIPSLARGTYTAQVLGSFGSAPPTPLHLSRDQDVELIVLSFKDMALIFGVPGLIALALLFIGRPHFLTSALRVPRRLRAYAYQRFGRRNSLEA
jgi:hypothetical protein